MGVRVVVKENVIESIRESVRVRGGPAAAAAARERDARATRRSSTEARAEG
jgi:hypothetical protein